MTEKTQLTRPDDVAETTWAAMDDVQRALAVSEDMRPEGISVARWNAWSRRERMTQAMFRKTEEWDVRGALSDMRPSGIEFEDLAIMARILDRLSACEAETLVRLAHLAAGPETTR